MNKIQKMVHDLCPNGVEWKTLGEVCEKICSGGTPARNEKSYFEGTIPWMRTQEVDWKDVYDTEIKITEEAVANSSAKLIPANCVIIAMYGATAAKSCINKIPLTTNQACCNLQINPTIALYRYVYYWVCNKYKELKALGEGSQNNINAQKIKSFPIPIPPLPVQAEIVNLLDKFTQLSAELKAELKLRRKQYDYYRNHLLSFDSNSTTVQWMPLGEVGTFVRGNGLQKKDFCDEGVGCIHYGQIYTRFNTFATKTLTNVPSTLAEKLVKVEKGDLVIACTSENVEDVCKAVAWLGEETIVIGGHAAVYKHTMNPKYVAYYFQTILFADQKKKYAKGVKVIDVKVSDLAKIIIPIPPIAEQERIVGILDKFETLVNDLSKGLPAEIALVQKQYEYYRNMLLTFE